MSTFRPDLLIQDTNGHPIAVIEVQSRTNMSSDVATEIRRSILSRGLTTHVPYFLLLSQDKGFLWMDAQSNSFDNAPNYEFPMNGVVGRYSKRNPEQRLYQTELELLILQWLTNLSSKPQQVNEEPERTLELTGFNDSIKDAMVLIEEDL
jgi:hypothetical protein